MQQTLTTPLGSKIRTQTIRRYVLVGERYEVGTNVVFGAWVEKRTDNLTTARKRQDKANTGGVLNGQAWRYTLMDTTTGRPV